MLLQINLNFMFLHKKDNNTRRKVLIEIYLLSYIFIVIIIRMIQGHFECKFLLGYLILTSTINI